MVSISQELIHFALTQIALVSAASKVKVSRYKPGALGVPEG
jgi:hypothetical protein